MSQYSGKHRTFDFGGLAFSWLAIRRRDELREALRYAHHLPQTPTTVSHALDGLALSADFMRTDQRYASLIENSGLIQQRPLVPPSQHEIIFSIQWMDIERSR